LALVVQFVDCIAQPCRPFAIDDAAQPDDTILVVLTEFLFGDWP